jgi:3-dehydroquinate synthase
MKSDKKVKNGKIRFVLARGIGETFITDEIALRNVRETLERNTST